MNHKYFRRYLSGSDKIGLVRMFALMCLASLVLCGCSPESAAVKTAPLTMEDQIKVIQNDPKMPPDAKEAAIRNLQQHQAIGAAMRQNIKPQ